jgi:hypothetical protein
MPEYFVGGETSRHEGRIVGEKRALSMPAGLVSLFYFVDCPGNETNLWRSRACAPVDIRAPAPHQEIFP